MRRLLLYRGFTLKVAKVGRRYEWTLRRKGWVKHDFMSHKTPQEALKQGQLMVDMLLSGRL